MPDNTNTNGQQYPTAPTPEASEKPPITAQPSQEAQPKQDDGGRRRPVSVPPDQVNNRPAGQPDKKTPVRPRDPKRAEEMDFSRIMRTVLLWAVLLLGVIFLVVVFNRNNGPQEVEVTTTEYQTLLNNNDFVSGKLEQYGQSEYRFHGKLKNEMSIPTLDGNGNKTAHDIVTNLIPETLNDQNKLWTEKSVTI